MYIKGLHLTYFRVQQDLLKTTITATTTKWKAFKQIVRWLGQEQTFIFCYT